MLEQLRYLKMNLEYEIYRFFISLFYKLIINIKLLQYTL